MIESTWLFVVKEEARYKFELVFGPGGAWSKLFARFSGFRGATLLRDIQNPCRYLVMNLWDSEEQRLQALKELGAEYTNLELSLTEWCEERTELGVFRALAEATVYPRPKMALNKTTAARRSVR